MEWLHIENSFMTGTITKQRQTIKAKPNVSNVYSIALPRSYFFFDCITFYQEYFTTTKILIHFVAHSVFLRVTEKKRHSNEQEYRFNAFFLAACVCARSIIR